LSQNKNPIVGTSELAGILGVTDSRIRQLERSGIIKKAGRGRYDLASAVQGYCAYLKEAAEKEQGLSEKDLLDRTRRQKIELEIQIMQGELHRAQDVERVMNDMLGAFRARCLAIPHKLAPRLLGINELPAVQAEIKKDIYDALTELSDYDPSIFYAQSKDKLVLKESGETKKPVAEKANRRGSKKA
jgi:phage terminase Nu1 subunit (DNA packaging protein)